MERPWPAVAALCKSLVESDKQSSHKFLGSLTVELVEVEIGEAVEKGNYVSNSTLHQLHLGRLKLTCAINVTPSTSGWRTQMLIKLRTLTNAYVTALQKKLAPEDPPLRFKNQQDLSVTATRACTTGWMTWLRRPIPKAPLVACLLFGKSGCQEAR